jgi:hypothetical protein
MTGCALEHPSLSVDTKNPWRWQKRQLGIKPKSGARKRDGETKKRGRPSKFLRIEVVDAEILRGG